MRLTHDELMQIVNKTVNTLWPDVPFDRRFFLAQILVESAGDPNAVSPVGARGLMQLMPMTALDMGLTSDRIDNPDANVFYGITYLKQLYVALGKRIPAEWTNRLMFAFASYNGGMGYVYDAIDLCKVDMEDSQSWHVCKRWLMHRNCYVVNKKGERRYPIYKQMWGYVDKIWMRYEGLR